MKKYILPTLAFGLFMLMTTSCSEEKPVGPIPEKGDATVQFRVNTPADGITGGAATRGGMVDNPAQYENSITNILVLLFRSGKLVQAIDGTGLSGTSTQAKFTVTTRASAEPAKFYLLANTPFTAADITAKLYGKSPEEVKQQLDALAVTPNFHGAASPFAFWGETDMPAGLPASTPAVPTQVTGVKMLRSVARAIITKSVDNGTLQITNAYIYRMNNKTAVIPSAVDAQNKVAAPTIPAGTSSLPVVACDVFSLPLGYYLSESAAPATPDAAVTQATCIVIGGKFGGSGVITYYRIDFENRDGGTLKVGQILRNHSYAFNIQSVSSPGWSTPEEAANNRPTGLKVEVKDWADKPSESFQNNEYTFTVSSREIPLAGTANSENYVDFTTDAPNIAIQFKNGGAASATSIENNQFRVTLTNKGGGQYRLTAVAKTDNTIADDILAQVSVLVYNLTVDIIVRQMVASRLQPETNFMWIASDGALQVKNKIDANRPWRIESQDTWIRSSITGDMLTVWGEPNHQVAQESRTGTIKLVNDINQVSYISVKQVRWTDWTKAFLRGGDCFHGNANNQHVEGASGEAHVIYIVSAVGAPLTMAAPSGDVHKLIAWEVGQPEPANYAMLGDAYNYNQADKACRGLMAVTGQKWKLPSFDEATDFLLRMKRTATGTVYTYDSDNTINYFPSCDPYWDALQKFNQFCSFVVSPPKMLDEGSSYLLYITNASITLWNSGIYLPLRCVRDYTP